ncbi:MAG: APC family permease [Actinomycetota bacterium]
MSQPASRPAAVPFRSPDAHGRKLRREVGIIGLTFFSLGSIIGSGWLFGSLYAAQFAGPAALLSWGIAGVGVIVLALIHAELGAMYPVAGGTARFPHYAFGSLVGFSIGWITWLGAVTVAPIEVEAALQYATNYVHGLTHSGPDGIPILTGTGYVVAAGLMLLFTVINIMGVRRLSKTNAASVWWKVAIPLVAIAALIVTRFHGSNLSAGGGFMPLGFHGVLTAIAAGGVIFALLGFEQAVQMAGESRNPKRNVPRAVIAAMLIGVVIYLLLQVAFLGAFAPHDLAHGWSKLNFTGAFGPFAGLATGLGLGWLATLLYADAFISPAGTGLVYSASSSRLSFALSRNGYIPTWFQQLNARGVPWFSILFTFVVGMIIFLPFPGWQQLVTFISSATVLGYAAAPLALGALRREEPDRQRPYRLRAAGLLAPAGFVVATMIVYFAGWTTNWKLFAAIGMGFIFLALSYATKANPERPPLDWRASAWMWPYFGGLALLSYLGSFDGADVIKFPWDLGVVAAFSLAIYWVAMATRLPQARVREYERVLDATEPEEAERARAA